MPSPRLVDGGVRSRGGGDNPLHDQDAAAVGLLLEPLEPLAWLEPDRPDDEPEPDLRGEDAARALSDEPERSDPDFPDPDLPGPDPPDPDPDLPDPDPPDPDPDLPDPDPPDPDPPDPLDPGFSDPDLSAPVFSDPDLSAPELSDSDFSDEPAPSDEPEPFTATRESLR